MMSRIVELLGGRNSKDLGRIRQEDRSLVFAPIAAATTPATTIPVLVPVLLLAPGPFALAGRPTSARASPAALIEGASLRGRAGRESAATTQSTTTTTTTCV